MKYSGQQQLYGVFTYEKEVELVKNWGLVAKNWRLVTNFWNLFGCFWILMLIIWNKK